MSIFPPIGIFVSGLIVLSLADTLVDHFVYPILWNNLPSGLFRGYDFWPTQPWRQITILYAALTSGIIEEVIFRGMAISLLQKYLSPPKLVFSTAFLFSLIHWSQGLANIISTFIFGALMALWVIKFKDIYTPIAAHTLTNYATFNGWI